MKGPFKAHTDAGHGWLAVKRTLLHELGIADRITSFSYERGQSVYLEEDVDVATFFEAYEKRFGEKPAVVNARRPGTPWPNRSRIRGYAPYRVRP